MNEMKVYFSGDFSGQAVEEPAGSEIPIRKWCRYGGYEWLIPAAYSCAQGLIVDVLRKIPMEEVKLFQANWGRRGQSELSRDESARRRGEDPMSFPGAFEAVVNGRKMEGRGFIGLGWQGMEDEHCGQEEKLLAARYDLDPNFAWYCCRTRFIWPDQTREEIRSLEFVFKTRFCGYPCGCYFNAAAGCQPFEKAFTHPFDGRERKLHVESCVAKRMDEKFFCGKAETEGLRFPEHYLELEYFIEPDGGEADVLRVEDRVFSDSPVMKDRKGRRGAAAVGIIGGAQGLTSVLAAETGEAAGKERGRKPEKRLAFSSLHFEPPVQAEWYVSVHRKPFKSMPITLIET